MDTTIMNVSIQALVTDLNTTVSGVQSAIALNALLMAAFVMFGGKLADIIGMKTTFMIGVFLYLVGSLVASFSNNLAIFIFGWCLIQGIGAALMLPNVQTIIRATLAGEARVRAYGAMTAVNALGAALGPIVGGYLTTYFSWRWAFRLEVVALLFIVVFHRVIPADKPITARSRIDYLGTFLQASAMISFVSGILLIADYGLLIAKKPLVIGGIEISPFGLGLSPTFWLLGLGTILLLLFIRVERRKATGSQPPLVRLDIFRIADFVNGLKVRSVQVSVLAGVLFIVPLFMQVSYGISAFETGLALLPLSISLIIGAFLGVRLGKARLPRTVVMLGSVVVSIGALSMVVGMNEGTRPLELSLGLSIFGFGAGLIGSQIVNLILSAVSGDETAEASGVTSTLEQTGNSLGVAILGTILTVSLSLGLSQMIAESSVIPTDLKFEAQQKIEAGVNVVSDAQISAAMSGYEPAVASELLRIYDVARTNAFRISMILVAFAGLLMFIFSFSLPDKKLMAQEV
jgi:MFS family permease